MPDEPITPHAGPTLDPDGQLSYLGEDGRRYVILGRDDLDEIAAERVMGTLREASDLFHRIEVRSKRWLSQVCRSPLRRSEALALLLARIETALERGHEEDGGG